MFKWNFQSNSIFHAFGDFLPHLDLLDPSELIASHNGLCHRSLHFLYFYCRWRTCWTYGMNFTAFVISITIKLSSYQTYFEFEYVYWDSTITFLKLQLHLKLCKILISSFYDSTLAQHLFPLFLFSLQNSLWQKIIICANNIKKTRRVDKTYFLCTQFWSYPPPVSWVQKLEGKIWKLPKNVNFLNIFEFIPIF